MLSFFKNKSKQSEIQVIEETEAKASFKDKLVSGATAIEYGLIAALVAVAIIGAVSGLGNGLNDTFEAVSNEL